MKINEKRKKTVTIALVVCTMLMSLWKCFYTVDIFDESYIYADALSVIKGNLPYAYNFSSCSGMSFITIPFLWIYMKLVPSLTGVVLYLRLCFVILKHIIVFLIYKILRIKHECLPVLMGVALIQVWYYCGNGNCFGYNSSSTYMILLASVLLYVSFDEVNAKKRNLFLFVSGISTALGVFAHPLYAIAVAIWIMALLFFSASEQKITNVIAFCLGGIMQIIIVVIGIVSQSGLKSFLYGMEISFFRGAQNGSLDRTHRLIKYINCYGLLIAFMLLAYCIVRYAFRKKYDVKFIAVNVSFCVGMIYVGFLWASGASKWTIDAYVGTVISFVSICLVFAFRDRILCFIALPFIFFSLLIPFLSKTSQVSVHTAFAIPACLAVVICLIDRGDVLYKKRFWWIYIVVFAIAMYMGVTYVYNDANIFALSSTIEEGVYKGLHTSEVNAKCLPEIEKYIRENTTKEDVVSFRDNVPFAYLMFEGEMCDIQTWDSMQYTLGWNEPWIMYNYYKNKGCIPEKIIYIDTGRDKKLSIEDEDFAYNSWVNTNYNYVSDNDINELFRTRVYEYNGAFNGDFSWWTAD